jgi:hypothetical protein
MTLAYGFVKARLATDPVLKGTRRKSQVQYHLRFGLSVDDTPWEVAVNVGTNDADDHLKFKLVRDFRHPLIHTLAAATAGTHPLTGLHKLPALDFLRSDLLAATGHWRDGDVLDDTEAAEPGPPLSSCSRKRAVKASTSTCSGVSIGRVTAFTTRI